MPPEPITQRLTSREMMTRRTGLSSESIDDIFSGGFRVPCITLVSTPVLMTRPRMYSVFRRLEPRIIMFDTLSGVGSPPSTYSMPVNLFVAAFGCSHSTRARSFATFASCSACVAPRTDVVADVADLPLRFVSPSSDFVSTWQPPRMHCGSGSSTASTRRSAGACSRFATRRTSPTRTSTHLIGVAAPLTTHSVGELFVVLSARWRLTSSSAFIVMLIASTRTSGPSVVGTPPVFEISTMHWSAETTTKKKFASFNSSSSYSVFGRKFHQV